MAKEQEEIVVIEDPEYLQAKKKKQLKVLIGAGVAAFIALAISIYFLFFNNQQTVELPHDANEAEHVAQNGQRPKPVMSIGEVEKMIEKAKAFYKSGDKEEALRLYEQIAQYSQSASSYNLGVAKMEDGNCEEAMKFLNSAIGSGSNELPALLNSAVCSLKMGKERAFKRYLSLAKNVLPKYADNPLYSYYYTLIKYYDQNYYAALASINAPTSKYYSKEQAAIGARIYLGYNDTEKTLDILEKQPEKDFMSIGLLQARLGKYQESVDSLQLARDVLAQAYPASMALQLVSLKKGDIKNANDYLAEAMRENANASVKIWPITVGLKDGVFESDVAQQAVAEEVIGNERNFLGLIFYFAQYKIFTPNKSIANIKKGTLGLMVNDEAASVDYLQTASKQSSANAAMIRGLEYVFDGHIYLANKVFKELEKTFSTNPVLLYNLALSYAQLGEYQLASKYFLKSYQYDAKNIDSGVYAFLISSNYGKLPEITQASILDAIQRLSQDKKEPQLIAIYGLITDNFQNSNAWIKNGVGYSSLDLTVAILVSLRQNKLQAAQKNAEELLRQNPNNIVANALYLLIKNNKKNVKSFALEIQEYLTKGHIDYNQIFYGPDLAGSTYIALGRISGMLSLVDQKLSQRLRLELYDRVQLLKTYSMAKMYQRLFEESYKGYSELVLKQKVTSALVLFNAGASSIGANHFPDAISFFELTKMADKNNPETLYALALLYQEAGSLDNAMNQYKGLPPSFESSLFDFNIVNKE